MLSLKSSDEIAYNGSNNTARMDLFADTAADLTGVTTFDSIVLLAGSSALDISTGDLYRMQSDGTWILQPGTGAFSNVYTKAEIDAMIANYYTKTQSDDLYEWITVTITTDTLPLTFIADGTPLISWSMKGNGSQIGTPTPDAPIMPDFCGTLDGTDWKIPISCAGQTVPLYLGQVQTVRKIKKYVFTGNENTLQLYTNSAGKIGFYFEKIDMVINSRTNGFCTHFLSVQSISWEGKNCVCFGANNAIIYFIFSDAMATQYSITDLASIKSYLQTQYAAGHPVTIWYVLATEQTGISNEPLCKIGDYADELNSTDAGVTIPTVKGSNTLTVDTDLQPSEMSITGKIRET